MTRYNMENCMHLSGNFTWFPVLEANQVFFEILIALSTLFLGALTIFISIIIYRKQKQIEAQFGFYMNILVFLERLNTFLSKYSEIFQLFFDERTRGELFEYPMINKRAAIVSPTFINLCGEFIEYLSTTGNIVPPVKICTDYNRTKWYKDILTLTRFLHKGNMIDKLFVYTSKEQYDEYNKEADDFKNAIKRIHESICKRLKLDCSLNSWAIPRALLIISE